MHQRGWSARVRMVVYWPHVHATAARDFEVTGTSHSTTRALLNEFEPIKCQTVVKQTVESAEHQTVDL